MSPLPRASPSSAGGKHQHGTVSSPVFGATKGETPQSKGRQSSRRQLGCPCIHSAGQTTPEGTCPHEFLSGSWISSFIESYWLIYCKKTPAPQLEVITRQWISPISHLAMGLKTLFPSDSKKCSPTPPAPCAPYIDLGAEKEWTWDHPCSLWLCPPQLSVCLLRELSPGACPRRWL